MGAWKDYRFQIDPETLQTAIHMPSAEKVAADVASAIASDHNGKVRAALASRLGGATVQTLLAWQNDTAGWTQQLQRFQDLHQTWQKRGFMVAWREYLHQDGVIAGIAERPAGERILTNLMHLAELLHEESRQRDGVHHLCEWLALQRVQPQDSSNAELRLESDENLVRILTIHASKGLEYRHVFLVGVEEGILPHRESLTPGKIEEERRLMYVGITRAQHTLNISYCERRKQAREYIPCEPSRFIDEMGKEDVRFLGGKSDTVPDKAIGNARLDAMKALLASKKS